MPNETSPTKAAPVLALPWPAVAILMGTAMGAAALAGAISPDGALPALIGAIGGLVAVMMTPLGKVLVPFLAGFIGMVLLFASPGPIFFWVICLAFCAGAGLEAVVTGGRATVMMLFVWLSLTLMATMPPVPTAVSYAVPGLAAGWLATWLFKLDGTAALPKGDAKFGVGLAVFLAVGLGVSINVIHHIHNPFSHWLMVIFIMRALAAPGMGQRAAMRFGVGAMVGSLAALAFIALDPPHNLAIALAMVLMLLGLRLLPHPRPYTPAAFSAAVLLLVSPNIQPAIFRLEVTVLVVALSIALASALRYAVDAVDRRWHLSKGWHASEDQPNR